MLTGEILRAARAMARLEQAEFARVSGVSLETIKRLERIRGPINVHRRTASGLTEALALLGIVIDVRADGSVALIGPARGGDTPARTALTARPAEPSALHRLIYYSTATDGTPLSADQVLEDILTVALERNARLGVTGCLLAADGRFMQALEGPEDRVAEIYASIARDPRHRDLQVSESRTVQARRFADWLMCSRSTVGQELARADSSQADGFRPERLSPAACLGVLAWVADLEARALSDPGQG